MDCKKDINLLDNIFLAIDRGENIILHGPGGCGKSFSILEIVRYLIKNKKNVGCTATTGVAAMNLNIPDLKVSGKTLHSWAGVGLAQHKREKLLSKVYNGKETKKRWLCTDVLIIDEVSMLGSDLMDKLDFIGKNIRPEKHKAFGGMQIVLSGDFLQLPPVKEDWVFNCSCWDDLNFVPFIFETPKRYNDEEYFQLLLRIRKGKPNANDIKILKARVRSYNKLMNMLDNASGNVIKPTILYSRKNDVNSYNKIQLNNVTGDIMEYVAEDDFSSYNSKTNSEYYYRKLDEAIPKCISLKVGAQVMLRCNLDVAEGLVNGSRGVVLDIDLQRIYVRFINGKKKYITKYTWTVEDNDGIATRTQFPFILAWAYTIHKSQSCTLDYAVCDLGLTVFECGQAYVALSRVRNKKGLFISNFDIKSIKTNKCALEFSENLQKLSEKYNSKKEEVIVN